MNQINHNLRLAKKSHLALALLPLATIGAVLAATVHSARADQTRTCEDYGVVRDRSDYEAPLLPRQSVAHCARSYQTLYQTYRVRPATPNASDSNPDSNSTRLDSTHSQVDNSADNSTPNHPTMGAPDTNSDGTAATHR